MERALSNIDGEVHVEVIEGSYDFQSWLDPMSFDIHGIAIVESDEAVNHCWRLILRSDLHRYLVNGGSFSWDVSSVLLLARVLQLNVVLDIGFLNLASGKGWAR